MHGLTVVADKYDVVDIRTVQIDEVVVLLRHFARHEALVLQRVARHDASCDGLLNFVIEFLHGADALLGGAVLVAPDGQRSAPETRAREVPVVQVLKPVAKAA